VSQRHEVQPDIYCRLLRLPSPIFVSAKDGVLADLFQTVIKVAMTPSIAMPKVAADKQRRRAITGAAIVGITAALLTATFLFFRFTRK
jgi:Ras family protein T1